MLPMATSSSRGPASLLFSAANGSGSSGFASGVPASFSFGSHAYHGLSAVYGSGGGGGSGHGHNSNLAWVSRYLRRGCSFAQLDLDYTFYQLIYACRSPSKVYKLTQHRKQTKNQWARDDPAFVLVIVAFLVVMAVAYGLAYGATSPLTYLWLTFHVLLQFLGVGALLATACWAIANKYLRSSAPLPHSVETDVEWLFAWDVHCNAFVPVLLGCYVVQFFLLPLLMRDGFVPLLIGNALYAAAACQYWYITFAGYLILPFLQRPNVFLLPIAGIVLALLVATLFQLNVPRLLVGIYVA